MPGREAMDASGRQALDQPAQGARPRGFSVIMSQFHGRRGARGNGGICGSGGFPRRRSGRGLIAGSFGCRQVGGLFRVSAALGIARGDPGVIARGDTGSKAASRHGRRRDARSRPLRSCPVRTGASRHGHRPDRRGHRWLWQMGSHAWLPPLRTMTRALQRSNRVTKPAMRASES